MKLKEITSGLSLAGVEPTQIVSVVATVPLGYCDGIPRAYFDAGGPLWVVVCSASLGLFV